MDTKFLWMSLVRFYEVPSLNNPVSLYAKLWTLPTSRCITFLRRICRITLLFNFFVKILLRNKNENTTLSQNFSHQKMGRSCYQFYAWLFWLIEAKKLPVRMSTLSKCTFKCVYLCKLRDALRCKKIVRFLIFQL